MLTFGTFFSFLCKRKKDSLTEPELFCKLIRIGGYDFKQNCLHSSSFSTTLRKYKNGHTQCCVSSEYYPLNKNTFRNEWLQAYRDKPQEMLDNMTKIADEAFNLSSQARIDAIALPILKAIYYDESMNGNAKFLNYTKAEILSGKCTALDELFLEVWTYVVKHGDLNDPDQDKTVEFIDGGMNVNFQFHKYKKDEEELPEAELYEEHRQETEKAVQTFSPQAIFQNFASGVNQEYVAGDKVVNNYSGEKKDE